MSETPQTPEALRDRLRPDHLIPETTAELRQDVEKTAEAEERQPGPDPKDPRLQKVYPFDFQWRDGRGKLWVGKFINHILNIRERSLRGLMRAKLAGGMPYESLDMLTAEQNLMVAHLTYSLEEAPDWAENLMSLTDPDLVAAIYEEVALHEATFRGLNRAQEGGQSGG
jgi:hypothetical protein